VPERRKHQQLDSLVRPLLLVGRRRRPSGHRDGGWLGIYLLPCLLTPRRPLRSAPESLG